jgi:ABC-type transport system substrate-binding protein
VDPKTGKPLRLRFELSGTSTVNRQFGARLRDDLRRIGIEVDTTTNTFPQLVEKMRGANYQMSQLAWSFDYPDAQNILQLLYGPNRAPGIGGANFADPTFDALYEQAALLEDSPERTALYEQMARIVATEVPWVTRAHRVRTNVQQPWLEGFKYTEVHDQFWRVAGIDADERHRRVTTWNRPVLWPVVAFCLVLAGAIGATIVAGQRRRA